MRHTQSQTWRRIGRQGKFKICSFIRKSTLKLDSTSLRRAILDFHTINVEILLIFMQVLKSLLLKKLLSSITWKARAFHNAQTVLLYFQINQYDQLTHIKQIKSAATLSSNACEFPDIHKSHKEYVHKKKKKMKQY